MALASCSGTSVPSDVTRDQNGTWKGFLDMQHSVLYSFYFFCPTRIFVYIHTPDCIQIVYKLLLLPNKNTVREKFVHKSGSVWSIDWILTIGLPA
jgi:hypothetical protein